MKVFVFFGIYILFIVMIISVLHGSLITLYFIIWIILMHWIDNMVPWVGVFEQFDGQLLPHPRAFEYFQALFFKSPPLARIPPPRDLN